jgi:ribosomal protein L37AE/L43A
MRFQKRYGESKIDECPFCGRQSITTNKQDIPVCMRHKDSLMQEIKCVCGQYLEPRRGKYGLFFICSKCGIINKRKAFEVNTVKEFHETENEKSVKELKENARKEEPTVRKEITIDTNDVEWFS